MDFLNGFGDGINGMAAPASLLAWQMFVSSGEPGMYMLYRDLSEGDEDKRFE